jgi:hypothetical protein
MFAGEWLFKARGLLPVVVAVASIAAIVADVAGERREPMAEC